VVTKFAVTVTVFAGMVNVVVELVESTNITPLLAVVQFLNFWPDGGVPAEIVTFSPGT
jgi:hypothetical protein